MAVGSIDLSRVNISLAEFQKMSDAFRKLAAELAEKFNVAGKEA